MCYGYIRSHDTRAMDACRSHDTAMDACRSHDTRAMDACRSHGGCHAEIGLTGRPIGPGRPAVPGTPGAP